MKQQLISHIEDKIKELYIRRKSLFDKFHLLHPFSIETEMFYINHNMNF